MDPITSLGSTRTAATTAPVDRYSELNSQDFVKIMFTELAHQDPTQPSDSKALLDQLSSLRNIQSSMDLSTKLEQMVVLNKASAETNELSSAAGLIGKYVRGVNEDNEAISGRVYSVSRTDKGAVLNLYSGDRIPMRNLSDLVNAPSGAQP